jgi:phage terminase large subunit-like protein
MSFVAQKVGRLLNEEEKKKAILLLAEMKSRGMEIPEGLEVPESTNITNWNLDPNGYFVRNDGWAFKPRIVLEEFINCQSRFILLQSGRGGGKTASGVQKSMKRIALGESGAVMNPDFENFRTSTWPELQKWIPWNMVVPKHRYRASPSWEAIRPFTIVFMNGAKMYCKGLKDPESARGANLNWFWYDEGRRDPTGLGWKNAIAFLRIGNMPQAWCTTTMAGMEHWTNTFFQGKNTDELTKIVEEVQRSGTNQELFSTFKTSTKDNSENLDPMFYASLVSAYPTGYLRTREIDGEASDEGGSLGDRRWFDGKELPEYPDWAVKNVRFWDLAATEAKILRGKKINDPDETVGSLVGYDMNKDTTKARFVLQDSFGGWWEWSKIKEMILETAKSDGAHVEICFEQEPASGGKNQIAELTSMIKAELPQWKVSGLEAKKLGDRVLAANTWFSEAANGQWYYVKGLWNEKVFQQLDRFDGVAHDDRITSITGARYKLAPLIKKWSSVSFLSLMGRNSS